MVLDQCRTTHRTRSSKDDDTLSIVDRVLDQQDQEFWLQPATNDFEKEYRANGDEISSSLASAAKVFWQKTIKQEALELKLDKASTPANWAFLLPKRTNTEVWKNLPSDVRTGDVKLQDVQKQHKHLQ